MNDELDTSTTVAKPQESTSAPRQVSGVQYIETTVEGSGATGLTIVDTAGRGTFHPDDAATTVSSDAANRRSSFASSALEQSLSVRDLYPHWQDNQADAGIAIRLVSVALQDVTHASDLGADGGPLFFNHLVLAENSLFQAVEKSRFNKAFELVAHFCAWALRNGALVDPNTLSLPAMQSALQELQDSPFITSHRATAIVSMLEKQNWRGESAVAQLFADGIARFEQSRSNESDETRESDSRARTVQSEGLRPRS